MRELGQVLEEKVTLEEKLSLSFFVFIINILLRTHLHELVLCTLLELKSSVLEKFTFNARPFKSSYFESDHQKIHALQIHPRQLPIT